MSRLHLDLPAEPASISRARDAIVELELEAETLVNLRLLVSEVVTNAVRHTDADDDARVRLVVDSAPGHVRIEVHDQGAGFDAPAEPAPRPEGTSGWGLYLVNKLARRWGSEPAPDPHVWFELARA